MTTAIQPSTPAQSLATLSPETLNALITNGDCKSLTVAQRTEFYRVRCERAGLDPAAQPFEYLTLNGKMILYARKACTDQLASIHKIRTTITSQVTESDMRVVTCRAEAADGRVNEDVGVVGVAGLKGEALGNAMMKAVTKAKRRTILSLCGLGMLDESEVETIPGAIRADPVTGEVAPMVVQPPAKPREKPARTVHVEADPKMTEPAKHPQRIFEGIVKNHPGVLVPPSIADTFDHWGALVAVKKAGSKSALANKTWREIVYGDESKGIAPPSKGGKREQALRWIVEEAIMEKVTTQEPLTDFHLRGAWALKLLLDEQDFIMFDAPDYGHDVVRDDDGDSQELAD